MTRLDTKKGENDRKSVSRMNESRYSHASPPMGSDLQHKREKKYRFGRTVCSRSKVRALSLMIIRPRECTHGHLSPDNAGRRTKKNSEEAVVRVSRVEEGQGEGMGEKLKSEKRKEAAVAPGVRNRDAGKIARVLRCSKEMCASLLLPRETRTF